jgi:hypothetical protein
MRLKNLIKPIFSALFGITLLAASPLHAAGTTPLALVPQVDSQGNPAASCLLTFYVAGTVATLQNAYADFGLTQPLANPLSCDQAGRVPMHWLADGLIHIRLTDSSGLQIVDTTMQVLGPSSGGGGGGGTVDPTSIMSTGDLKVKYATGPLTGFVRTNGLTIGNAGSGATERANADTQALFIFLYNCGDATLVVSGGRAGNALNDYNAGKTITLPNYSGRALAALDNQGAGAAGVLTTAFYGTNPTVLGAPGGVQSHAMILGEAPIGIQVSGSNSISVSGSGTVNSTGVNTINSSGSNSIGVALPGAGLFGYTPTGSLTEFSAAGGGAFVAEYSPSGGWAHAAGMSGTNTISVTASPNISVSGTASFTSTGTNTITGTSTNTGGSAFATVSPLKLATIYMKL